jgi:anti-sigma-K factor RskA
MTDHDQIRDNIPAYSLGILDEEQVEAISAHIASCPSCQAELHAMQETIGQLGYAASDVQPRAEMKEELLSKIQAHEPSQKVEKIPWWQLMFGQRPAFALVSVGLILVLAVSNVLLWTQVRSLQNSSFGLISLTSSGAMPEAKGMLIVSADGRYGTLVASNLDPLDETQQYQLWLIRNGERTSGGVFSVSENGYTAMQVYSREPLASFDAFGITIEPYGGSPGPTGEKVLGGDA